MILVQLSVGPVARLTLAFHLNEAASHLAEGVQRRPHERLQEVQADRLQHVQVVGHLVPHGLRAVDDVLWADTPETQEDPLLRTRPSL